MDFKAFFKHISRYKWIIILIPVIAVGITFFMVKNLPKQYSSEAQISTGLVDQSKQVSAEQQHMDYFKTSQQFSNIIEKLKLKKNFSILSYRLILHDLEDPKNKFKKYSEKIDSLSAQKKQDIIAAYRLKLAKKEILTISNKEDANELYDLVASMGYDQESVNKNLSISRNDGSDFINISYVSENPLLSAYLVNTLTTEFIANYTDDVDINQNSNIALLDSLLKKKEAVMNEKNTALRNFKMANGVLNLDKQSEIAYAQISTSEDRKSQALRDIQANQGAIAAIENRLRTKDPLAGGTSNGENREIIDIKNQIKEANERYIDGGFKIADRNRVDSLSNILNLKSIRNSDKNIVDPTTSKANLIAQRAALEIAMNQAKGSILSIDKELKGLKAKYSTMVPFDAGIQNYEREADLATKDYMDALNRYNQTRTEQNFGLKLNVAQIGLIGKPEPSKKVIYLASAGVSSFSICLIAVIALFFLDNTINTPKQLQNATNLPILGNLSYVNIGTANSIKDIWNGGDTPNFLTFKNLLRSLRLDIASLMDTGGHQILGITSLSSGEGKSFVSSSLSHAFAMTGKKVLLIGGEKSNVRLSDSKAIAVRDNFETFMIKREIHTADLITVLNKNEDHTSLLEIQSSKNLKAGFEVLRKEFDLIIIDINSLRDTNVAKEWLMFTEKSLAIFEVGRTLSDVDKDLLQQLRLQPGFMGWVLNKIKIDETV